MDKVKALFNSRVFSKRNIIQSLIFYILHVKKSSVIKVYSNTVIQIFQLFSYTEVNLNACGLL